jgi:hypothetical protein
MQRLTRQIAQLCPEVMLGWEKENENLYREVT